MATSADVYTPWPPCPIPGSPLETRDLAITVDRSPVQERRDVSIIHAHRERFQAGLQFQNVFNLIEPRQLVDVVIPHRIGGIWSDCKPYQRKAGEIGQVGLISRNY